MKEFNIIMVFIVVFVTLSSGVGIWQMNQQDKLERKILSQKFEIKELKEREEERQRGISKMSLTWIKNILKTNEMEGGLIDLTKTNVTISNIQNEKGSLLIFDSSSNMIESFEFDIPEKGSTIVLQGNLE